eukprot:g10415.t1
MPGGQKRVLERRVSDEMRQAMRDVKQRLKLLAHQPEVVDLALEKLLLNNGGDAVAAFADKESAEYMIIQEHGDKIAGRSSAKAPGTHAEVNAKIDQNLPKQMQHSASGGTTMKGLVRFLKDTTQGDLDAFTGNKYSYVFKVCREKSKAVRGASAAIGVMKEMVLTRMVGERWMKILRGCRYILLLQVWNQEPELIKKTYKTEKSTILADPDDSVAKYTYRVALGTANDEEPPAHDNKELVRDLLNIVAMKKEDMAKQSTTKGNLEKMHDAATSDDVEGLGDDIVTPKGVSSVDYLLQAMTGRCACDEVENVLGQVLKYCDGLVPNCAKPTGMPARTKLQLLCNRLMTHIDKKRAKDRATLLNDAWQNVIHGNKQGGTATQTSIQTHLDAIDAIDTQFVTPALKKDDTFLKAAKQALFFLQDPDQHCSHTRVVLVSRECKAYQKEAYVTKLQLACWNLATKADVAAFETAKQANNLAGAESAYKRMVKFVWANMEGALKMSDQLKALQRTVSAAAENDADQYV